MKKSVQMKIRNGKVGIKMELSKNKQESLVIKCFTKFLKIAKIST